jgi:hypothetical protein
MYRTRAIALLVVAGLVAGCNGDSVTDPPTGIVGSWNAASFTFTAVANPAHQVDLINDLGGSMNLTIQADGTFTGTVHLPDVTPFPLPIGGTVEVNEAAGTLDVHFNEQTLSYGLFTDFTADFTLDETGQILTWSFGPVPFAFPQNPDAGEEPAMAVVVLTRV